MRIITSCGNADVMVIAEEFKIDGCSEKFGVHRSHSENLLWGEWTATHAETGLRIAVGDTLDETVSAARAAWNSRTPEQIAEALARAREVGSACDAESRELVQ